MGGQVELGDNTFLGCAWIFQGTTLS
ncbi:hypothetical protein DFAR_1700008 [Desulfarculales bacterium]